MIEGVTFKDIVTYADDRGFFREIIRVTDPFFKEGFGQCSHSLVYPEVVKAWHGHHQQTQWTYVACGLVRVVIHDPRPQSATYRRTEERLIGEHQPACVYRLPPGVVHGYRCLAGPAHVFYVTSGTYDPNDEIRLLHDEAAIGYDWSSAAAVR